MPVVGKVNIAGCTGAKRKVITSESSTRNQTTIYLIVVEECVGVVVLSLPVPIKRVSEIPSPRVEAKLMILSNQRGRLLVEKMLGQVSIVLSLILVLF